MKVRSLCIQNNFFKQTLISSAYSLALLTIVYFIVLRVNTLEPQIEPREKNVFKVKNLMVGPSGETYIGRFQFTNKSKKMLTVASDKQPKNFHFEPQFVAFQQLENGVWIDLKVGYDGLPLEEAEINPNVVYELEIDLFAFRKKDERVTVRVGIEQIWPDLETGRTRTEQLWSDPFVLDWPADQAAGKFTAARKVNLEKVREYLVQMGFKKELLRDDNFPNRMLREMLREVSSAPKLNLEDFLGKLDVIPIFTSDEILRFDCAPEHVKGGPEYRVWMFLNKNKFSAQRLRKNGSKLVTVAKFGNQLTMEYDYYEDFGLSFCVDCKLPINVEITDEDQKEICLKIKAVIERWFK